MQSDAKVLGSGCTVLLLTGNLWKACAVACLYVLDWKEYRFSKECKLDLKRMHARVSVTQSGQSSSKIRKKF